MKVTADCPKISKNETGTETIYKSDRALEEYLGSGKTVV